MKDEYYEQANWWFRSINIFVPLILTRFLNLKSWISISLVLKDAFFCSCTTRAMVHEVVRTSVVLPQMLFGSRRHFSCALLFPPPPAHVASLSRQSSGRNTGRITYECMGMYIPTLAPSLNQRATQDLCHVPCVFPPNPFSGYYTDKNPPEKAKFYPIVVENHLVEAFAPSSCPLWHKEMHHLFCWLLIALSLPTMHHHKICSLINNHLIVDIIIS